MDPRCEIVAGRGATKGDEAMTHMQLDGEPWPQAIPAETGGSPVLVRLRSSQANM